jgi:hypothetical protein
MSKLHIATTLAAALLLAAASVAPAQTRRDRRDRFNRDGGRSDRESTTIASSQPTTGPGAQTRPSSGMDAQYAVLLNRSIFNRSGLAAPAGGRPAEANTRPSSPVLSPEQAVVFVGVIAQDDEFIAFAENQTTHQLMVLRAGDDVAHGKVMGISLDTLAYGTSGAIKEVHLGQNLAGEVVSGALVGSSSTTAPAGSSGSSPPSTAGMTPEQAAVMERLRKRRESGQ